MREHLACTGTMQFKGLGVPNKYFATRNKQILLIPDVKIPIPPLIQDTGFQFILIRCEMFQQVPVQRVPHRFTLHVCLVGVTERAKFCNHQIFQTGCVKLHLCATEGQRFQAVGIVIGKIINFDQGAIASSLVILRNYFFNICDDEFLLLYLDSPLFFSEIKKYDNGTAQPNLAAKSLEQFLIPLPPLYEQKRIVAKIEELLPLVDRYAAAYEKLEQFNAKFPEDMKKSILQYAIQGKLVEQRAEEGTGEELYQQIQAEKQQLIEEKKIKKEKPLAEISEDEIPFDIPGSWKWVRVGEIFAHNTGKAMNSTAKKVDKPGSVKRFITTSNLYWNSFDFSSVKEMFFSDDELERCTVTKGDLLMCEGGAYYGRTAIWNYDYDICFQNHVHRLRPYKAVELRFFYHLFYFYKSMNMMNAKGTAMPGLSSQTLHQMVVPLPPLSEQKRIVAKIEELLPLCERLK